MLKKRTYNKELISYDITGTGPVMVWVHGFLGDSSIWDTIIDNIKSKHTHLRIDLPGHGNSSYIPNKMSMVTIANLINEILEKEQIKEIQFIGHSMGGYVALAFAKLYPQKTTSITLLNSTALADTEQKKEERTRAIRVFDLNHRIFVKEAIVKLFYKKNLKRFDKEIKLLQQIALNTSVAGAKAALNAMMNRSESVTFLRETQIPVHYISGKHDHICTYQSILSQIEEMNASLTTLEDFGHMGFLAEMDNMVR